MKVIDLLNKIANGEEVPKYINYTHRLFGENTMMVCEENIINELDTGSIELNDEVEIIEENKKIEKLPIGLKQTTKNGIHNTLFENEVQYELNEKEEIICSKINEIIDQLNEMNDK